MFSKLATDDEFERKQVVKEISSHILGNIEGSNFYLFSLKLSISMTIYTFIFQVRNYVLYSSMIIQKSQIHTVN